MPLITKTTCSLSSCLLLSLLASTLYAQTPIPPTTTSTYAQHARQWLERFEHTQNPSDLREAMRAWQQSGQCAPLQKTAQRYLNIPDTPALTRHEALHALQTCQHHPSLSPPDIRERSALRSNLSTLRRLATLRHHAQRSLSPAQLAAWSVAGEGAANAATSTLYAQLDLEPRTQDSPDKISAQGQRRFAEARRRISATHWIIPTIYSISGAVTRDGLTVYDEQVGVEARLVPVYRSGGLGARLFIRF